MRDRVRRLSPSWGAAILSPSLAWIACDRAVWPWDQAWFGVQTVQLFEALRAEPLRWPAAMLATTPMKPPAVAWIGQAFVPLGLALRSVDAGLLLSIWATHLAALIMVFHALRTLAQGRTLPAATGMLALGTAPVFIALTTQYLAEAAQTLAVAWFVLLLSRAPVWPRSRLAAHLLGATSFAMLAKASSPLYCALPGLLALAHLVRRHRGVPADRSRGRDAPLWILALALAVLAGLWYARNLEMVRAHVRSAAFSPLAEHYGRRAPFLEGLGDWLQTAADVWFLPIVGALVALVVAAGLARRVRRRTPSSGSWADVCAAAAAIQVMAAMCAFALSPNRDARYAAPLLPLAAVVVAWALAQRDGGRAGWLAAACLVLQAALVHTQVLGLWPGRPGALRANVGIDSSMSVLHRDGKPAAELAAIVERTCGRRGFGARNLVGVDLLALNGHSLTYAAAKERLAGRAGACQYDSLAYTSVEVARGLLGARQYVYWIGVDPGVRPVPAYFAFLNQSAPVVFRQLRRRGVLQPEPWDGPPGIVLYRFVRR